MCTMMKNACKRRGGTDNATMRCRLLVALAMAAVALGACNDDDAPAPTVTQNTAVMIKDEAKREMLYSLRDLEGNRGRIYEMTYNVDYKLDEALNFGIDCTDRLKTFVALNLMDTIITGKKVKLSYDAGCSAFACPDGKSGHHLMGRNFDFNHINPVTQERDMIPVIVVHTAPEGGKKSVSFVDGKFVDYKSGFYTDGTSDLSMLMALPYLLLDGINEDGFAVSVLKLDGLPTLQQEPGKKKTFTTVAMRMMLDRAGTVKEALAMLEQYNMCMDKDTASYHFFMADATGDYAIVEYTNDNLSEHPYRMEVLTGHDTLRYVTNFYVSPTMADTEHGSKYSQHGKNRYDILKRELSGYSYRLTPTQAMAVLDSVAQGPEDSQLSTGFTQWSEVYNLSKRRVAMTILREWGKQFEFGVE